MITMIDLAEENKRLIEENRRLLKLLTDLVEGTEKWLSLAQLLYVLGVVLMETEQTLCAQDGDKQS